MGAMSKSKDKPDPVRAVLAAIHKAAGKGAAQLLSEGIDSDIADVVPTGIDVLDHHVLGIGGLPVGRIVELFGGEGDGKTSLLLQFLAGVQREGGVPFLAETEHALDSARGVVFGADLDRVVLSTPHTLEEALARIEDALDAFPHTVTGDPPFFCGWDSLAATPTEAEIKLGLDPKNKETVGVRARVMSHAMRVLTRKVSDKRAVMVVVNQTRQKIGAWGGGVTTPGGEAIKFHASVRLQLFSGKSIKVGDDHVGKQVTVLAVKNKCGGKPWAKAKVRLYYETGWSNPWSTVWHAKDRGMVSKDAKYTEESYAEALAKLGWPRGFAAGRDTSGDVAEGLDDEDERSGAEPSEEAE